LRIYPTESGVGTGRRGRTETFVQLDLDLLRDDQAGYLWLVFSADALLPGGAFADILARSEDYAADLGTRLRRRIHEEVVPKLAEALVQARQLTEPTAGDLATTYEMSLTALFRLLFVAYAEDNELLPYRTNDLYRRRSLKEKARELVKISQAGTEFDTDTTQWDEVVRLWSAVNDGKREWGVPPYNGGLFSNDPHVSRVGAELAQASLTNDVFGPILGALLLDDSPEGLGPVDFRPLGVREFGTIYEGLLENELSVAETDLTIAADGAYEPIDDPEQAIVRAGEVYLHDASGVRKSTGSYFTKSFAVEHLLDHSLEPALDDHIRHLKSLDDRNAGERFFDFRVADIAMGSGHFLVAAVDRIERRLSRYLAERPLPAVRDELTRLREKAYEALKELGEGVDIEDTQLLRRQIARRCIYGVDLNPIAVELARLSLWIHTFVPGLPLSFLEHSLVCGNSLVGVATIEEAKELIGAQEATLFSISAEVLIGGARKAIDRLARLSDADAAEIRQARAAFEEATKAIAPASTLFDVLAASRLDDDIRTEIASGAATRWVSDPVALVDSPIHLRAQQVLEAIPPFHFPTAFSEVFLGEKAGFDVIIGNPPWQEATIEEDAFWARYYPGLRGLPQREKENFIPRYKIERPDLVRRYEEELRETTLLRQVLASGPFPGMGTGDPDLYKAFCWRFWNLLRRPEGRIGVVLPRTAFCQKGLEKYRKAVFSEGRVEDITFLTNNRQWVFPDVHPQFTIALTTLDKTSPDEATTLPMHGPYASHARFTAGTARDPVRFPVSEVLTWTDTAALPLLPAEDSVEVFSQLRKAPRLDIDDRASWRARPHRELDATNDKHVMDFSKARPGGFWPVYKGTSFDIWNPDTGTYYARADPNNLVPRLQAKRERGSRNRRSAFSEFDSAWVQDPSTMPCWKARIAFRHVTRATDTRTMRAALLPPEVLITNHGPYFLWPRGDERDEALLLGVLCSIPLDWYARRFVEVNMNFHILNPFPIPRPSRQNPLWRRAVALAGRLACPDGRFSEWAEAVGVEVGPLDPGLKDDMIAELDAVVGHLYGLSEPQLRHIFETFHEGWDYSARLEATLKHFHTWEERP